MVPPQRLHGWRFCVRIDALEVTDAMIHDAALSARE
jgi:hypothetical protein